VALPASVTLLTLYIGVLVLTTPRLAAGARAGDAERLSGGVDVLARLTSNVPPELTSDGPGKAPAAVIFTTPELTVVVLYELAPLSVSVPRPGDGKATGPGDRAGDGAGGGRRAGRDG